MIKKYIVPTLLIIFAFALLVGSIRMFIDSLKDSDTNLSIDSLAPFNEVIHAPDSYRILDFDKWTKDGSPAKVSQVENSHISVIEDKIESVQKITDILNEKTFTPILKEEFDINYSDSNHIVKFWLSTQIDPEDSKVNFYPYNIFIDTNLNLYVAAEKKGDLRYLKSSITEDEYRFIEDSYNALFKEKEVAQATSFRLQTK